MQKDSPEGMALAIVESCGDCGICRDLMGGTPCRVFPELYRLYDKEAEKRGQISSRELRNLVDLCNFCALCPCPHRRSDIMKAKHAFVDRDGLDPTIRLLEDVERLTRICGAYPSLTNNLLKGKRTGGFLKKLAGIHPDRNLPEFPKENFASWAVRRGLRIRQGERAKIAYFAGCTGQYLFPDVPKAVVDVLQQNEIDVYLPEQKCCGMPSLLEGDLKLTLKFAAFNLDRLGEAVDSGCEIVCSCPTCAYMLKHVISEGCFCLQQYRQSGGPDIDESNQTSMPSGTHQPKARSSSASIIDKPFRDEGCLASLDASKRIKVASHTFDLGEYLRSLLHAGQFNNDLGAVPARMAYYPPCHLREQNIGEPYADLLRLAPGISMERIDGLFHCCGIAGIMGLKRDFHQVSVEMGSLLMARIAAIDPERLVTDCLSCRIQFNQLIPYRVFHPIEILSESYANYKNENRI